MTKVRLDAARSQKQTAVDLLLKAAAKARALRLAAGEESEEEAPLPDLPMAKRRAGRRHRASC